MMNEFDHQVEIFRWADYWSQKYPALEMLYSNTNGGLRNLIVAKKLKAAGAKKGIPDIVLPFVNDLGEGALYIELKRPEKSTVTREQQRWIARLNESGNRAVVCKGWVAAVKEIASYLNLPDMVLPRQRDLRVVK